jgi:NADH-quinone oxidoreductase subunit B
LSWVVGPQGASRMPERNLRDEKRAARVSATTLRTPDDV